MNNQLLQGLLIFSILLTLAYVGKGIILPFMFAFLLWIIITSWRRVFSKIKLFGWTIPKWMQTTFSLIVFMFVLSTLSDLLSYDLGQFSEVYPTIENNLQIQSDKVFKLTGFDTLGFVQKNFENLDIASTAQGFANGLSSVFGVVFTMLIYLLFIFGEQKMFTKKLKAAAGEKYEEQKNILSNIITSVRQYISIKTSTSLLTGGLSYIVMVSLGLEFAFVWAFMIFILNFIPSIGSLIATSFPVLFAFLSFNTWWQPLLLLVLIGTIQVYVGNILEPKYMGKKLNISPLLVIFGLFFWGALWGIPGMFLSVPLTVIIMISLSKIPATRSLGIWMSGDGVV